VFANDNITPVEVNGHNAVVFDFDNFIFRDLWDDVESKTRTLKQFKALERNLRPAPGAGLATLQLFEF